jgi:hypothetical protein
LTRVPGRLRSDLPERTTERLLRSARSWSTGPATGICSAWQTLDFHGENLLRLARRGRRRHGFSQPLAAPLRPRGVRRPRPIRAECRPGAGALLRDRRGQSSGSLRISRSALNADRNGIRLKSSSISSGGLPSIQAVKNFVGPPRRARPFGGLRFLGRRNTGSARLATGLRPVRQIWGGDVETLWFPTYFTASSQPYVTNRV